MKLTAATLNHLDVLRHAGLFADCTRNDLFTRYIAPGACFAMLDENEITVAAGGVFPLWPGVGVLWLAIKDEARKKPKTLLVATRAMIELMRNAGAFHRFQMHVDPNVKRDIRFTEALGFTFEGKMSKFTSDEKDQLLYAKTY